MITIFLGRKRRVVVSHLSLTEGDAALALRRWVLEGSVCDGDSDGPAEWQPVYHHHHHDAAGDDDGAPVGGVRVFEVSPPCHRAWQYLRVRITAANASPEPKQQWRISLAGIEIYGTLYDDS
eukprot:NODE_22322_length_713_cov_1.559727.p2 GENE.NODE_22322_length_713_cov_1.559727~~NODE_22322_length_713_cov_1.559727.p2  ORF type:complete len:122 (-),score=31.26 NODE_22322_length_713_cov_1.559727:32-397(-)